MNVLWGPTFTFDDSSSPPPAHHTDRRQNHPDEDSSVHRVMERPQLFVGNSSESSSSIGTPDDSGDEEEGEEEVQSKLNRRLGFDSLTDSLPIKKGLSEHFDGKSKSFSDLSQVSSVKELQKQENPFNKRRRVLMSSRWSRRSAFYTWSNPKSMPLLPLHEIGNEQEVEENCRKLASPSSLSSSSSSSLAEDNKKQEDQMQQLRQKTVRESTTRLRPGNFKPRSFSLADLKEHDDEEDD